MGGSGSKAPKAPPHTATNDSLNAMDGAVFYVHKDFKNQPGVRYSKGNYANHASVRSDTFSSAKIAPGCQVHMYEHDHFNGRQVTKPEHISDTITSISNLHDIGMGDKITSLEVVCDEQKYCNVNPLTDKIDCRSHCPPGTLCNVQLARYCSDNLDDIKCKEFCMNPYNNCDDDKVENYCKSKQDSIGMIPYECQCIMYPPVNDLERRIDQGNGGVYHGNTQLKKGNYACWSSKCKNGTAPESDQLHLSKWWNYISGCTPITICNVDLGDANIDMYDRSLFVVNNDCDGGDPAASADLVNSGTQDPPQVEEEREAQDAQDTEGLWGGLNEFAMVAGLFIIVFIFVFFLISMIRRRKMKRALSARTLNLN